MKPSYSLLILFLLDVCSFFHEISCINVKSVPCVLFTFLSVFYNDAVSCLEHKLSVIDEGMKAQAEKWELQDNV
jgi:hypothetical protein